tara:strand:+ start:14116 stop:16311 length:2196 start_codon:yes stop_codon:yes gene_type:complete
MSYINKQSTALVRVKLTDIGRELLAKGQLTFNSWMVGDSEIDYDYVKGWKDFEPSTNAKSGEFLYYNANGIINSNYEQILRPKDKQPFFKSFLLNKENNFVQPLNTESSARLIKGIVSNEADDRGFFSGSTVDEGLTAATTSTFIKETGTIDLAAFSGETDTSSFTQGVLDLTTALTATSVNDYIVFQLSNSTLGNITGDTFTSSTINQFYNILDITGNTIYVDRALPTLSADSGTIVTYYTIPGGNNPADNWYGASSLSPYWHTGTLAFDSSCDICSENIPVWNMSNVWNENMAGQYKDATNEYHPHTLFGSEQHIGTNLMFGYKETADVDPSVKAQSVSYMDTFQKGISIIHYTNSCISNYYGEFFHIDGEKSKLLNLDVPILWHRRSDGGTESGSTIGMRFVSDTVKKTLTNSNIEYYDLIEYSGMSVTPTTPLVVGKVFHNLKMVTIENEELLAAMSYKSNRNYTLPDLKAELVACQNGACTGVLKPGETLYMTYYLASNSGVTETLPCQRYTVIKNNDTEEKDVQFRLNNLDQLPYMRKIEKAGYDGRGFYANDFVLLAQVVDETLESRPDPEEWREIDFTGTDITSGASETIDPKLLENQNPNVTGFLLEGPTYTAATTFNLGLFLDLPEGTYYNKMNFGDERLFYGNLRTHIGATIYKTLFSLNIDGAEFGSSSNVTYEDGEDRYVSEVGVLDNNQNLVMVGKLSRPIRIANATTATIEVTMDF